MSRYGIVIFDGVCNLCNGGVRFVARRSTALRFVASQTPRGEKVVAEAGLTQDEVMRRFAFVDTHNNVHRASGAALRIAMSMHWPWPLLSVLLAIPPFMRDFVYDIIAHNRYRMFGKSNACQRAPKEIRDKFLE